MFGKGSHLDPINICCVLPSPCDIFYTNTEEANVLSMTHVYLHRRDAMTFLASFILAPQYIYLANYAIYIYNEHICASTYHATVQMCSVFVLP